MSDVAWIAALWLAFAVSHMALSSLRLRPRLVRVLGPGGFAGVYSLVALLCFVPLVWFYGGHKHSGPLLWAVAVGDVLRWALYLGNGLALVLAVGAFLQPSPASMVTTTAEPRGIHFLTRHALFMAIGIWGSLHLVSNGYASDVVFFAGFPLFALLGSWHQDVRKSVGELEYAAFAQQTPFLPFTGRHTLRGLRGLSPWAWLIGIGLTVGLRTFHHTLFGP